MSVSSSAFRRDSGFQQPGGGELAVGWIARRTAAKARAGCQGSGGPRNGRRFRRSVGEVAHRLVSAACYFLLGDDALPRGRPDGATAQWTAFFEIISCWTRSLRKERLNQPAVAWENRSRRKRLLMTKPRAARANIDLRFVRFIEYHSRHRTGRDRLRASLAAGLNDFHADLAVSRRLTGCPLLHCNCENLDSVSFRGTQDGFPLA